MMNTNSQIDIKADIDTIRALMNVESDIAGTTLVTLYFPADANL